MGNFLFIIIITIIIIIIIIIFFGKTLGLTSAPGCNKRGLKHKSECVTELISLK